MQISCDGRPVVPVTKPANGWFANPSKSTRIVGLFFLKVKLVFASRAVCFGLVGTCSLGNLDFPRTFLLDHFR